MKKNLNKNMEKQCSKAKVYLKGMASAMKIKIGHTRYQKCSCQNLIFFQLFLMNILVGCFKKFGVSGCCHFLITNEISTYKNYIHKSAVTRRLPWRLKRSHTVIDWIYPQINDLNNTKKNPNNCEPLPSCNILYVLCKIISVNSHHRIVYVGKDL